jgi:hypothetical protein
MDAKKLKLIVKGEKKPTFGTDPNEPWSARAGITESERGELHAYLKSRGINPDFVSKDTKISHAKSSEFHKWRRDHQFDDPINFVSTTVADKMKTQRAQVEEVEQIDELAPETLASYVLKTSSKDPKRAEPRKKAMSKLAKTMAKRSFSEEKKPKMTALDKFRKAAAEREKKHSQYEKPTGDLKGAIDRLEKHLNKEEVVTEKNDSHTHAAHYEDPKTGEWTGMNLLVAKDDEDAIRQAHEKCKEGCRLTKVERHITVKEEAKQIDELKMSTVKSYHKKRLTDFSYSNKKPGETSTKQRNARIKKVSAGIDRSIDRQTGYKPTSEDVYQDSQAATQTAFDMGTQADDREPTYSKRKEMSKSARMIKSLYRKHKMVKEDLYDHEKEDKSVASYGKKPKVDKQEVYSDDDTQAAMILKGGTTLTGQTRDTLEIDPVMRKQTRPDNKISDRKTDK